MRRVKRYVALLVALLMLAIPASVEASETQQDGYHFTYECCVQSGGLPVMSGHWVDDWCDPDHQPSREYMVTLYLDTLGGKAWTRICHDESNFACENCVPALPPFLEAQGGGWGHQNLNDRVSAIHVNWTPTGRCIRVYRDIGSTTNNPYRHLVQNGRSYGDYTAGDGDFPNDWISKIQDVAC